MNYASLYCYCPDLHLLTYFSDSITTIKCWQEKMRQDTISNSVVWLRCRSSDPPVVFFLIFFSASIIPSGYLMIPQAKANRVWDGYSGEAKVCFNVFFCCKLEKSNCLIKPECCISFQINASHLGVSESEGLHLSWRGFCSLCLESCSAEFMLFSEMAQLKICVHRSFCPVAHCHHGVSGPGEAQEGSILAGSGWLWV